MPSSVKIHINQSGRSVPSPISRHQPKCKSSPNINWALASSLALFKKLSTCQRINMCSKYLLNWQLFNPLQKVGHLQALQFYSNFCKFVCSFIPTKKWTATQPFQSGITSNYISRPKILPVMKITYLNTLFYFNFATEDRKYWKRITTIFANCNAGNTMTNTPLWSIQQAANKQICFLILI